MNQHEHSAELVSSFVGKQKAIFDSSEQSIYVFLDENSRACNHKFATLLGYSSSDEWSRVDVKGSFPDAFVDDKSQQALIEAYQNAMEGLVATTVNVTWKKKSGETVDTSVILVPVSYRGHLFALHFVS